MPHCTQFLHWEGDIIMYAIRCFLFALFHPSYWTMLNDYDKDYDTLLINMIKSNTFSNGDEHTVDLGPMKLWIANHPYGSFVVWNDTKGKLKCRASRLTIHKAYRKYKKDMLNEILANSVASKMKGA